MKMKEDLYSRFTAEIYATRSKLQAYRLNKDISEDVCFSLNENLKSMESILNDCTIVNEK